MDLDSLNPDPDPAFKGILQLQYFFLHFKKYNVSAVTFSYLCVIFALLDRDPDCESGSGYGSRDPIESGSNTDPDTDQDPDPQHWKNVSKHLLIKYRQTTLLLAGPPWDQWCWAGRRSRPSCARPWTLTGRRGGRSALSGGRTPGGRPRESCPLAQLNSSAVYQDYQAIRTVVN